MLVLMETTRTYEIPARNLPKFERRAAQLAKRAVRLGCSAITWDRIATAEQRFTPIGRAPFIVEIAIVEVTGPAPQIPGWTFAATLQHCTDDSGATVNILRALVEGIPTQYRDAGPACDHCRTARRRNDTYLVRSDAGEWKQIGKNCLADFTGHPSAQDIAAACEWSYELDSFSDADEYGGEGGGFGGAYSWEVERFLAHCYDAMALDGFVSRKTADYDMGRPATADVALHAINPPRGETYKPASDAAKARAEVAAEWAREWEDASDFAHNCRAIARIGRVEGRTAGIAAAICIAHERHLGRIAERAQAAESQHFGTVGKREKFTLTAIRRHSYDTQYGTKTIVVYRDDTGNIAVWFASGVPDVEIGHRYAVKATVKEHGIEGQRAGRADLRPAGTADVKQTVLTRVAVEQDHGNPRAISLVEAT